MNPIFLQELIKEDKDFIYIMNEDCIYYKKTFEELGGKFETTDGKVVCFFPIDSQKKVKDTILSIKQGKILIDSQYLEDMSDYFK